MFVSKDHFTRTRTEDGTFTDLHAFKEKRECFLIFYEVNTRTKNKTDSEVC